MALLRALRGWLLVVRFLGALGLLVVMLGLGCLGLLYLISFFFLFFLIFIVIAVFMPGTVFRVDGLSRWGFSCLLLLWTFVGSVS